MNTIFSNTLLLAVTLLFSTPLFAVEAAGQWRPPRDGFDWVQLNHKEWLMGEIKSMYKESLVFDSDNLDEHTIDWEDVTYLRSAGQSRLNIEGIGVVVGVIEISGDTVRLIDRDDAVAFNRTDLISLAPSGEREIDLWSLDLTLGVNLRGGNTEQIDYTSKISVRRRTARSRVSMDYVGNISKTDAGTGTLVETVNNHRASGSWDRYATRRFYFTPFFGEYYRDPFQNTDQRLTGGVGIGYTILDTPVIEWNVSGGPAYQSIRYISVQAGGEDKVSGAAVVLNTDYEQELNSKLDFIFKYNMTGASSDLGGYTHHMEVTLNSEITGSLDFDVTFMWDRVAQPTPDAGGNIPKPDDYRLMLGLSWSL